MKRVVMDQKYTSVARVKQQYLLMKSSDLTKFNNK